MKCTICLNCRWCYQLYRYIVEKMFFEHTLQPIRVRDTAEKATETTLKVCLVKWVEKISHEDEKAI